MSTKAILINNAHGLFKLCQQIKLLRNAVSNKHFNVSLSAGHTNQGARTVVDETVGALAGNTKPQEVDARGVRTIVMDDLLPLVHTPTAVLKIDIGMYNMHFVKD